MSDEETPLTRLMPAAGRYAMPLMQQTRVSGTEDPGIIRLHFEAGAPGAPADQTLQLSIPISTLDAAGLLRSLRMLQQKGILPFVTETPRGPAAN
jgi:hypothetical protein